jgi:hypothetical protein
VPAGSRHLFAPFAAATISSMISALLPVHLLTILQARDMGPYQAGARVIEC